MVSRVNTVSMAMCAVLGTGGCTALSGIGSDALPDATLPPPLADGVGASDQDAIRDPLRTIVIPEADREETPEETSDDTAEEAPEGTGE
ncbi:MAG: hypothetical protein AAGJ32_13155 [Pseudomonadota bacterium]